MWLGSRCKSLPRDVSSYYSLSPQSQMNYTARQEGSRGAEKAKSIFDGSASQLCEAKPSQSEPFLISIILCISQTPIHMLQRTQRLLIFLPVPGPSDDKSETQRNHTSLTNQPTNEEQRSLAKMTTSPVIASNILEAWGGRPQG